MKKLARTFVRDPQFWVAVLAGWFAYSMFMTPSKKIGEIKINNGKPSQCNPCVEASCKPCKSEDFKIKNDEQPNQFYRDFPWKPQEASEVENDYWTVSSMKYRDGMKNDDPRVGINGMWRLERQELEKYVKEVAEYKFDNNEITFERMMRKYDPFFGVSYIVKVDSGGHDQTKNTNSKAFEIRRNFTPGRPSLLSIKHLDEREIVHIITPLSKVTERFHKFLTRLEENIYTRQKKVHAKLIFVIFGEESSEDGSKTVSALQKFQLRNPTAIIQHVFVKGDFSRAIGLDTGVKLCPDKALMLFLDVDLSITPEFLNRVQRNTIEGERVTFPIMFSQFDPDIISEFIKMAWVAKSTQDDSFIGGDKGFWIYYAFGVASMYKSDYNKVGGFPLDIIGWGGEDVNLFKKFISDPHLDVMSTVDPDLIHIYHSRSCDVALAPDQYRMCIGSMSETIGSGIQIGTLYLKHKEKDYFEGKY